MQMPTNQQSIHNPFHFIILIELEGSLVPSALCQPETSNFSLATLQILQRFTFLLGYVWDKSKNTVFSRKIVDRERQKEKENQKKKKGKENQSDHTPSMQ